MIRKGDTKRMNPDLSKGPLFIRNSRISSANVGTFSGFALVASSGSISGIWQKSTQKHCRNQFWGISRRFLRGARMSQYKVATNLIGITARGKLTYSSMPANGLSSLSSHGDEGTLSRARPIQ